MKKYKIAAHTKDNRKISVCFIYNIVSGKSKEMEFDTEKAARKKIKKIKKNNHFVDRFEIVEFEKGNEDGQEVL